MGVQRVGSTDRLVIDSEGRGSLCAAREDGRGELNRDALRHRGRGSYGDVGAAGRGDDGVLRGHRRRGITVAVVGGDEEEGSGCRRIPPVVGEGLPGARTGCQAQSLEHGAVGIPHDHLAAGRVCARACRLDGDVHPDRLVERGRVGRVDDRRRGHLGDSRCGNGRGRSAVAHRERCRTHVRGGPLESQRAALHGPDSGDLGHTVDGGCYGAGALPHGVERDIRDRDGLGDADGSAEAGDGRLRGGRHEPNGAEDERRSSNGSRDNGTDCAAGGARKGHS